MNPIQAAVEPRRQAVIERAVMDMSNRVERELLALDGTDGNLTALYPHPHGRMSREEYKRLQAKRAFIFSITSPAGRRISFKDPELVTRDEKKIGEVLETAARMASFTFDEYVAKLTSKIGACTSAEINSAPLWDGSVLTITREDGSKESWKTSMILNVSSLGKLFNQWPTRKLK